MIKRATTDFAELYEADETAWLEAMVDLIQQGRRGDLDYAHLAEYLGNMARRDRREVNSRLATLLTHLLKCEHQQDQHSDSWLAPILEQRYEFEGLAADGVLRKHAEAILGEAYGQAVERAA